MPKFRFFTGPERRTRIRFPIALGAQFMVVGRQEAGTGTTVNISSHGVLIASTPEVSPGTPIGAVIEWPVPVGSVCPLALHVLGTVVRSDEATVAIQFSTYELSAQPKPLDQGRGLPKRRVRSR